jgi:hypothetical protein
MSLDALLIVETASFPLPRSYSPAWYRPSFKFRHNSR